MTSFPPYEPAPGPKAGAGPSVCACLALVLCLALPAWSQPPYQTAPQAVYVVRQGDTLESVARALGCDPVRLARHNGLARDAVLDPGRTLVLPGAAKPRQIRGAPAQRSSLTSQVAPRSAWETMTQDTGPDLPSLKGQAPPPVVVDPLDMAVTPDLRPPVDSVPASKAPTQEETKSPQRQAIGVRANLLSKGSTKLSGVISPVETTKQSKTPGQNDTGGTGGAGAGVILRHEF